MHLFSCEKRTNHVKNRTKTAFRASIVYFQNVHDSLKRAYYILFVMQRTKKKQVLSKQVHQFSLEKAQKQVYERYRHTWWRLGIIDIMLVLGSLVYTNWRYTKLILLLAMWAGKTVTIMIVKIATGDCIILDLFLSSVECGILQFEVQSMQSNYLELYLSSIGWYVGKRVVIKH